MSTKNLIKLTTFLLCFASLTAFGQSADNPETVKYSVGSYTPKGDFGAYLDGVEIGLSLVASTVPNDYYEDRTKALPYDKVYLTVKVWTDPVTKYKYNGKTYTDLCGVGYYGYSKVRIQVAIAGVGTKTITTENNGDIELPLNKVYKKEELNQIKVTSFKLLEMTPKESERKNVAHCVEKQEQKQKAEEQKEAVASNGNSAEQSNNETDNEAERSAASSSERGSAANQPRQQSNYEQNMRKYNAINRQIATVDKVHNEFNNMVEQAFESTRQNAKEAQQRSAEVWEEVKAAGAEKRKREAEIAAAKAERIKREESYNREDERIRAQIVQNRVVGEYDKIGSFSEEGLAWVCVGAVVPGKGYVTQWGFIDKAGNEIVPLKYHNVKDFSEGLASVAIMTNALQVEWKSGFIDKTGSEVIPIQYDGISGSFSEGLANVELNGKYGFIDKTDNEVIPLKYDYAGSFSEGLANVKLNGKYGFIDKTDNEVIPLKYDYAGSFSEGLANVKLNGKYGFIDKTGTEVTPLKYDYVDFVKFYEGMFKVTSNGKSGFIDTTGAEVIPCQFDRVISPFSDGVALVKHNDRYFYIDKTGKEVLGN